MPESVHLISIHPDVKPDSSVVLHIEVAGHSIADIAQLIEALQGSPAFWKSRCRLRGNGEKGDHHNCNRCERGDDGGLLSRQGYGMNRIYRRQRQQYLLAAIVGAIALINLLFFLILYRRPARSEYFNLRDSVEPLRAEIMNRQVSVAQKEKLSSQLETTDQDRRLLFAGHFIKREAGFAEILPNPRRNGATVGGAQDSCGLLRSRSYPLNTAYIRLKLEYRYREVTRAS